MSCVSPSDRVVTVSAAKSYRISNLFVFRLSSTPLPPAGGGLGGGNLFITHQFITEHHFISVEDKNKTGILPTQPAILLRRGGVVCFLFRQSSYDKTMIIRHWMSLGCSDVNNVDLVITK